jgi:hypothetical protein
MTIYMPTPLRVYAGGKEIFELKASTANGALDELTQTFPELRKHLYTGKGKLRAFVNICLNDEQTRG